MLTPGFGEHDVGLAPDGRLWVTAGARASARTGRAVQAADAAPQHVTFGDGRAFVTSGDSGTLHVQATTVVCSARRSPSARTTFSSPRVA